MQEGYDLMQSSPGKHLRKIRVKKTPSDKLTLLVIYIYFEVYVVVQILPGMIQGSIISALKYEYLVSRDNRNDFWRSDLSDV